MQNRRVNYELIYALFFHHLRFTHCRVLWKYDQGGRFCDGDIVHTQDFDYKDGEITGSLTQSS